MTLLSRLSRSGTALLASGALMIPLLASCGGGGGGSRSKPAAANANNTNNTIVFTPTDSCNYGSFSPNYAPSVDLLHWPAFPLRVYFVPNDEFSDSRQATALAGFNRWVVRTGGRADYSVVSSESSANITVSFYRFTGGSGDTLGTTTVTYSPDSNTIRSAEIEIGITGDNGDDVLTAAHEYGHSLGITGHSPSSDDLMHFTGNRDGQVTDADLNTAITAYCNNFNRNSNRTKAATGPLKTIVIH